MRRYLIMRHVKWPNSRIIILRQNNHYFAFHVWDLQNKMVCGNLTSIITVFQFFTKRVRFILWKCSETEVSDEETFGTNKIWINRIQKSNSGFFLWSVDNTCITFSGVRLRDYEMRLLTAAPKGKWENCSDGMNRKKSITVQLNGTRASFRRGSGQRTI